LANQDGTRFELPFQWGGVYELAAYSFLSAFLMAAAAMSNRNTK